MLESQQVVGEVSDKARSTLVEYVALWSDFSLLGSFHCFRLASRDACSSNEALLFSFITITA